MTATAERVYALGDLRLPPRFWAKIDVQSGTDCWQWTAALDQSGYGLFGVRASRCERAHRAAYKAMVGPIPDGMQLDHLCRNRACVNPAHLEPVEPAENSRRGLWGALRTHCARGHEKRAPGRCPECRRLQNLSANRPGRIARRKAQNNGE